MPQESLVACVFAGILLGWFSNGITKGRGVGLALNLVVGVASAILGASFLPDVGSTIGFGKLAQTYPTATALIDGAIAAAIALWPLRFVKRP